MGNVENTFRHATNPVAVLAARGWVYNFSASAANGTTTGTTTYANTTPSWCFHLPAASLYAAIPLYCSLGQTGTVAGGAISVIMEVDNADRYTSGGTAMTCVNSRTDFSNTIPDGAFHEATGTAITATNAYGNRIWGVTVGQDVSPAEGVSNELVWTPPNGTPEFLVPTASVGASWLINTNAGTTGATWFYSFKVAIFPITEL